MICRFLFCLALVMLARCSAKQDDLAGLLSGNWLILYPDHKLTSQHQRQVYGRYQDSIVSLYGLKLITLEANGEFTEADSLQKPPGAWMLTADSLLKIREGGKGFNPFNTSFAGLKNGELMLTQNPQLEDEKIKLVWHLKRVNEDNEATALFGKEANAWRKRPAAAETREAIRVRLVAVLDYYSLYFTLIGKEATYFAHARLPLPFRYYQHAVELTAMPASFQAFFFDGQDAAQGYALLKQAHRAVRPAFPRAENFVMEYGGFLKMLADRLRQKDGK